MRSRLRPLILVTLVSFLLGLWLSLRNAEKDLLDSLRAPPELVLLTDQPQWWTSVTQKARKESIVNLQILSQPRRLWSGTLNRAKAGCHLVTTKSFFLRHFLTHKWLESVDKADTWRELLHPDFREINEGIQSRQFLPLLWSVTTWQPASTPPTEKRVRLKTSLDDALLVAIDLRENRDDGFTDTTDNLETVEQIWNDTKDRLSLAITHPETHVPVEPVKAVQKFITESRDENQIPEPPFNFDDLWTWGVGFCPGHSNSPEAVEFINWLLEPQNISLLGHESGLGLTLMSGDHENDSKRRPSNLRGFSLERLRRRELSWDLAAAWEDLFTHDASR